MDAARNETGQIVVKYEDWHGNTHYFCYEHEADPKTDRRIASGELRMVDRCEEVGQCDVCEAEIALY